MSSDVSAVLALPFIQPNQAQKHVTHNEAVAALDLLVQLVVASRQVDIPPADPVQGDRYIVPVGALDAFAGRAGMIALWDLGAWSFLAPRPGWRAEVLDEASSVVFDGTVWQGPGDLAQRAAALGIGTDADSINRLAVAAQATLLTHEGSGHQLKINKAQTSDTASLLFQTGWSGRAEMGVAGDDDFSIKTSIDGTIFQTALRASAASGAIEMPAGLTTAGGSPSQPGLAFAGMAGTGVFSPAAGQIGLTTAGVQRAVLSASGFSIQVPVTGNAVTQTGRDRTAGRLVKVGDYGLGGAQILPNATSLEALDLPPGYYSYATGGTLTGGPETGAWPHALHVIEISASTTGNLRRRMYVSARVTTLLTSCRVWVGFNIGSDPILWTPMPVGQFLVGAVTQSGGVPTGAVMERGANSNGEFVRFADGTQICTGGLTTSASAAVSWTYPAAFVTGPRVIGTAEATVSSCIVADTAPGLTSVTLSARAGNDARRSDSIRVTATGRWF
jgi:hypothetical protein